MNEIEKQIEQMAKDIGIAFQLAGTTRFSDVAEILIEQGYRNCKDKVVLNKEEYHEKQLKSMLYSQMQEELAKASELKSEEKNAIWVEAWNKSQAQTAREILQELKTKAIENGNKNPIMGTRVSERDLCEFAKQYGVEVE